MIYVMIFLFSITVVGFLVEDNCIVAIISFAAILASFAALRGSDVAADFTVYESWYFDPSESNGLLDRAGLFEAIYFFLNNIFMQIGLPFRVFVWILAFSAVSLKTWVLFSFSRSAQAFAVALLIYTFSLYPLHDFTQIRAGLAVAVLFLAFRQLVEGHRWHFVWLVLMAAGFHSSALVAVLLLLPSRGRVGAFTHVALILVTLMFILLAASGTSAGAALAQVLIPLDPRLDLYLSGEDGAESLVANPLSLMVLLPFALVLSLMPASFNSSETEASYQIRGNYAITLACRSIIFGLCFLESMWEFQTVALRLYELHMSLIPILAALVFSRRALLLPKALLLLWAAGAAYFFVFRDDAPVHPYMWLFS
jgi:hypothetical protein